MYEFRDQSQTKAPDWLLLKTNFKSKPLIGYYFAQPKRPVESQSASL